VVAARQPERDQWLDDFEDPQGFEEMHREPSPRNPFQKKSEVRVRLLHQRDECFVLCTSSQRVAKDRAIREKQELRFLADVEKLRQPIAKGRLVREVAIGEAIGRLKERYPRVARYHLLSYDAAGRQFRHEPDEAKKAKAKRLDGGYLLRTDRQDHLMVRRGAFTQCPGVPSARRLLPREPGGEECRAAAKAGRGPAPAEREEPTTSAADAAMDQRGARCLTRPRVSCQIR